MTPVAVFARAPLMVDVSFPVMHFLLLAIIVPCLTLAGRLEIQRFVLIK
jgi:hypothetical protein